MADINNPTAPANADLGQAQIPSEQNLVGQEEGPDIQQDGQGELGTDNQEEQEQTQELPKNYKELQAAFTKRSQELAQFKKQYEALQKELEVFRQIYQKDLQRQQEQQAPKQKPFEEMTEIEKFNYLVDQRIQEAVNPYVENIQSLESYIQFLQQQEANRIWNEFTKEHPDAVNYADQLAELITKHNIDLDKAYKLIKADLAPAEAKQKVLEEIQVKKEAAKLQMPQAKAQINNETPVQSIEEAYQRALAKLSKK